MLFVEPTSMSWDCNPNRSDFSPLAERRVPLIQVPLEERVSLIKICERLDNRHNPTARKNTYLAIGSRPDQGMVPAHPLA